MASNSGTSGEVSAYQFRRPKRQGFDLWVGEISGRRAWKATQVFLPGESHGQRSLVGQRHTCFCEYEENIRPTLFFLINTKSYAWALEDIITWFQ